MTTIVGAGGGTSAWRATLAAFSAALVGIGLSRFAYTPLIPALIAAGWFTPSEAAYLGAANMVGYLVGALFGQRMTIWVSPPHLLRIMMLLATAAMFACAVPLSFLWFFVWRLASGVSGGALMVLAAPTVLPHLPPSRRGLAAGVIFTGVGLGVAASGTLVPLLLQWGLVQTWCGLGAMSLLLTLVAWGGWPSRQVEAVVGGSTVGPHEPRRFVGVPLMALYGVYGLIAFGIVPHMIFLVDFVARGLERGLDVGARYWVLFGLGAMAGPVIAGYLGDRIGFRHTLRLALLLQAVAVGWLAVSSDMVGLIVSSLIIGAFTPGNVPIVLGRLQELMPSDLRSRTAAWGRATTVFAVGQAGAAYGFSYIFARTGGDYPLLFALAAAALVMALAIELVSAIVRGDAVQARSFRRAEEGPQ